ncbi:PilZ domain-containing protein [Desulfobacter curvatus]|uniref:PilZ domain-containing protein n=1 Tax=Desulfobacter curvatus TaxID=2290 RepID=UPI0003784D03|nr:PilZ domain-containing protein [Desulfobacter curvatus]
MTVPKVFVTQELTATIACESCGQSYTKDVSKFVKHKARVRLKYTCKCGHSSSVILERRQVFRKEVRFKGILIQNKKKYPGMVIDISRNGIRFTTQEKALLKVGNTAEVVFALDNPTRSEVHRPIRIRKAFSEYSFGCEFVDTEHLDDLGKYFLFHF